MGKEDLEGEIWKDIPGYEGLYQVSNLGRVYSCPKEWVSANGGKGEHNGGIMRARINNSGYYQITLSKEGERKTIKVHQLVAMGFLGHVPNGYKRVVDHRDNNPLNNNVSNLQLITSRENTSKDTRGTSKYCGVSWGKLHSKWRSDIRINGQPIYLGSFDNEEEAAEMYQLALSNIDKYNGNPKEFRQYLNCKKNC